MLNLDDFVEVLLIHLLLYLVSKLALLPSMFLLLGLKTWLDCITIKSASLSIFRRSLEPVAIFVPMYLHLDLSFS